MASYRKRSGGWRAEVVKLGIRDSQTFATKAAAVAWATHREAEILAGSEKPTAGNQMTLSGALRRYKRDVSTTEASQRWEELRLDKMDNELTFVGEMISDITADQIADWRDLRLKKVSGPSVRRDMTLLSSVFEIAKREWKCCTINPVREVKRPSNGRPRDRRISAYEEGALTNRLGFIEGVAPVTRQQELAYAFLLALETAMRQGEILGLKASDLRLKDRYVRLEMTKNGESRNVPLTLRAGELLEVLVGERKGDSKVFTLNSASADAMFRKIRDELHIVDLHFRDTRHEATTRLAR
ncbi:site-specific integrase [Pseudomonas alliivorans]|uniref:tyrosine-type recombinase/integrase n=1 Tax=Pseudomonas alliivorans TaxID=2810613 RepID=UPI002E2B9575|nr:site-specific integrase [Pseudomonas alliivorans]MEE4878038.1 site-specific integrase [Pseudomonas alliivorans]MEE4928419.1 site-specific integrase [Pseudomonas alliivorans]MEE4933834.1 site-specific integrase [Pseudomonas alliivorans]MEE4938966.1 site-specific integrase [Pseudomonas alliivorans]MEE4949925.1 site-specific integrase [Pseudomonas alliivorans]